MSTQKKNIDLLTRNIHYTVHIIHTYCWRKDILVCFG